MDEKVVRTAPRGPRVILQENIRDKLRGLPIDVSVNIEDSKRKRRQSSDSELAPVLDASVPMKIRSEVRCRSAHM